MRLAIPQKRLGPWSFFLCVLLVYLAGIISVDMYVPALPGMQKEFDVTASYLNLTMFAFFAVQAVGVLAFGPLSDRFGRRKCLVFCCVVFLLGSLGCMMSPGVEMLVAFRVVQAFAFGGMVTLCTALIQDAYEGEDLRKAQSALQSLILVGPAVAPFLGSLMLVLFDWRAIFAFISVGALVAVGLSLLISEVAVAGGQAICDDSDGVEGRGKRSASSLRQLLSDRKFVTLSLFMGVAGIPWFAFIAVVSYILMDFFGTGYLEYSVIYAAVSLVSVISPFVYLKMARRLDVPGICKVAMALVAVTLVAYVLGGKASVMVFALGFLPYVLAEGVIRPMSYVVLLDQPPGRVGLASSLVNFSYSVITSFATVVATLSWGNFVDGLIWITAGSLFLMFVLYLLCFSRRNRT